MSRTARISAPASATSAKRRRLQAEVAQERLLGQPVLRQRRARAGSGRTGFSVVQELEAGGRHVLEFEGDDVDRPRRSARAPPRPRRRRRCARAPRRRPAPRPRAHRRGSAGRSSAPPSPACGRAGRRRGCRSSRRERGSRRARRRSGIPPPRRVARRARPRSRRPRSGSASASTAAASSAALTAPGLADGQRADRHAGRHLHDRQQAVLPGQRARSRPARRTPAAS